MLDTSANERYHGMSLVFEKQTHAVILVYDITRHDSLLNTRKWFRILRDLTYHETVFTALAGNKADLVDRREVTYEVICVFNHISGLCQAKCLQFYYQG